MLGLQTKYLFVEQRRVLRGEVVNTFGFRLKVIKMCAGCPKGGAPVNPELPWSPRNRGPSPDFGRRLPANGAQNWQIHSGMQALSRTGASGWGGRAGRLDPGLRTPGYIFFRLSAAPTARGFRFISKDVGLATPARTL